MIFFLVCIFALAVAGFGLLTAMLRRDEPALGMAGMVVLMVAGVAGSVYGVLAST